MQMQAVRGCLMFVSDRDRVRGFVRAQASAGTAQLNSRPSFPDHGAKISSHLLV